ncbi:hypothetical protein BDW59DRAFT_145464 [Aspergillus cavernicola]|uniref:Uncharacterized protein n=1 Tax=Aspergillus cavernicola TaxID=176166 RepID=A0ABR4IEA2_9EURO
MDGPPPPPPPPPHGEKPNTTHGEYRKSSDLPQGNYDIFVIPPHSAGSGFLYLPSLQCQRNSFLAGSACMLVAVYLWTTFSPVVRLWYVTTVASGGGTGIAVLAVGVVGIAGWAFGNYQAGNWSSRQGRPGPGFGPNWFGSGGPGASGAGNTGNGGANHARGGGFGGQAGGPHQQGNYGGNFAGGPPPGNQYSGNQYRANNDPPPQTTPGPNPNTGPDPGPPPAPDPGAGRGSNPGGPSAKTADPGPQSESKPHTAEDWEKAREETRRKEELRRKMEEFKRKREAEAREKERQREREKMEKELRERREQLEREMATAREAAAREARLQAEKEAAEHRARLEREAAEARAKAEREAAAARQSEAEARARIEREAAEARAKAEREAAEARARAERLEAAARARAEKEAAEKEAAAKAAAKKEADAKFAALKEAAAKKYAEKKARDAQEAAAAKEAAAAASKVSSASAPPRTPSPKKPAAPQSKASAPAADDDAYTFRPYDRPRRPYGSATQSSVYSESSYAPSQSTARTTPPPSQPHRSTYETKDPDKIVIRAVYAFNQAMLRTPVAQLVSGQGLVTEGLVLRITTEGLFIDDDVRGVPQREWDVKAWTMKLVEVWCPQVGPPKPNAQNQAFFRRTTNTPTPEESDAYLANFLKVCKNTCRLASPAFPSRNSTTDSKDAPPCGGLHVLRATIRDQEGRRYLFILQETEGWKVALGLQRLRKGSQVRALGVCGMALAETRSILSVLDH